MKWHAAWAIWTGLGLVMEAVGLKVGGPLTRTVRVYLLGGAAGSAAVGAFLTWLAWHWLAVASGIGPGDVIAVAVGAAVGLAGWAYRLGRGDGMLQRLRMVTSWAWPILAEVGGRMESRRGRSLRGARPRLGRGHTNSASLAWRPHRGSGACWPVGRQDHGHLDGWPEARGRLPHRTPRRHVGGVLTKHHEPQESHHAD